MLQDLLADTPVKANEFIIDSALGCKSGLTYTVFERCEHLGVVVGKDGKLARSHQLRLSNLLPALAPAMMNYEESRNDRLWQAASPLLGECGVMRSVAVFCDRSVLHAQALGRLE